MSKDNTHGATIDVGKVLDEHIREHTPLPGNRCHTCAGQIVKKVVALYCGRYHYSIPECSSCGRTYFYAEHVPSTGEKEFEALLHSPFTI